MRTMISSISSLVIDFIFPPAEKTLFLRKLSPENVSVNLKPSLPPPYPFITCLFSYKDPLVTDLIWGIKYKKDRQMIALGAFVLYKKLLEMSPGKIVLIPIPISNKRKRERGFNQCQVLIEEILKLDKENRFEKRFDILFRTKHLSRQTLKDRKERLKSTSGIFSADKIPLSDPIVIIDDVTTTGSTLREARETLLKAGYENVRALTIAH